MAKKSAVSRQSANSTSTASGTASGGREVALPSNAATAEGVASDERETGFLSDLEGAAVEGPGSGKGNGTAVDPHTGDPEDTIADAAAAGVHGAGGRLPHADRIQEAFGAYDVSGVRAHTDAGAAGAIGANAYAMGADVVFGGAPSLHTAAEEATHAVVQGAGKGPGGVGQEGDRFEKHADAVAAQVVSGGSAEALLDTMTGGDRSVRPGRVEGVQREAAAPTGEGEAAVEGPTPPSTIALATPGGEVVLDVPSSAQPGASVTVNRPRVPIPGVAFDSVTVALDENFNPRQGSASVSVDRGIVSGRGNLDVVGNRVVGDVDVDIDSPLGRGRGTARMTEAGIESEGTIAASEVRLSNGLAATEGSAHWTDGPDGLAIDGRVAGTVPELGDFDVDLAFAEGQVGGEIGVDLVERSILGQAKVTGGSLRGTYGEEGITVRGPMGFAVGDWATGSSDGTLDLGARTLNGNAAATVQGVSKGDLTLHTGSVQVGVADNQFEGGEASFDLSARGFRGGLQDGRYDPTTDQVDGTVNATWEGEEAQEVGNVSMKSATGQLAVEGSRPTGLTNAAARVGIKVGEEVDKIDAGIESLDYDLEAGTISGRAVGSTSSPIEAAEGAVSLGFTEATAEVADNSVSRVSGAVEVEAGSPTTGRLLGIAGTGDVDVEGGTIENASGTASLLQSPVTLVQGFDLVSATGTAAVRDNTLEAGEVDAGWRSPTFEGTVDGAFDAENVQIDGEVSASVHTETRLGPATLSAGSGNLTVEENTPTAFAGSAEGRIGEQFGFSAENLDVDVQEGSLGGTATVGIEEGQSVAVASVGSLEQMNATGEVVDNEIQSVQGEIAGDFAPGGSSFLDFSLDGRFRATDNVVENASGDLSLAEGETRDLGPITLDRFQASATVTENAPQLDSASVGFSTESFSGGIENATVDVEGESVSGTAEAELTAPKRLGNLEITAASGSAEVTDNALGALEGSVQGSFATGEEQVDFSAENVDFDLENDVLSGEVTASTSGFMNLLPSLKAQVTEATGEVAENRLTSLSGDYDVRVAKEGTDQLSVGATGELDVENRNIVEATGEASLLAPLELFGGALGVSELAAEGTVQNNALQSGRVTAVADIQRGLSETTQAPRLQIDGTFQESEGDFDFAGEAGMEEMQIIQPGENGRQLSASMEGTIDTAADEFSAAGGAEYRLNENFGGSLDAEMDQDFDPGISGSLDGEADLVEEKTLFSMTKTVVYAPIPPIFGASLDAELSMGVGQLTVAPEISLTDMWHPISAATEVPDFDTQTQAQWGITLEGGLSPYLYGGIRSSVITAAIGGMGRAALAADATIATDVGLTGEGGEFSGELGLGVNVGASLDLSAGVFAQLGVLGWDAVDWRRDDLVEYTLADLFDLDWAKTFTFGDRGNEEAAGTAAAPTQLTATEEASAESAPPTAETSRPRLDESTTDDSALAGGPAIGGESALAALSTQDQSVSGDEGQMGALETAMNALSAMRELYQSVGGAVQQLANVPFGVFQLIWDIVTGDLDFGEILEDARAVFAALDDLLEFVGPMLSGWFETFWNYIKDGPPNLLLAFWGDSAAFRDVINDGETIQNAPAEMLVHLLEGALWDDMWTSGADEAASIRLLEVAASRGLIDRILTVERTRDIFRELDHQSDAFRRIVVQHAPASVLRAELGRFTGHWRLNGDEEREAMSYIRAANDRGMLTSILSQDDAEDILSGMDGSRYDEMERILRANGYDV
jgi:hypothetical protein